MVPLPNLTRHVLYNTCRSSPLPFLPSHRVPQHIAHSHPLTLALTHPLIHTLTRPQVLALIAKCRKVVKTLWPDAFVEVLAPNDGVTTAVPPAGTLLNGSTSGWSSCLWFRAGGGGAVTDGQDPVVGAAAVLRDNKSKLTKGQPSPVHSKHLPSHVSLGSRCVHANLDTLSDRHKYRIVSPSDISCLDITTVCDALWVLSRFFQSQRSEPSAKDLLARDLHGPSRSRSLRDLLQRSKSNSRCNAEPDNVSAARGGPKMVDTLTQVVSTPPTHPVDTLYQTHTPYQPAISTHTVNTSCPHTLSTHPINPSYQPSLA